MGRISGEAVDISDELEPGLRILADVALRVVQERHARRPRLVQADEAEEPLDGLPVPSSVTLLGEVPDARQSGRAAPSEPGARAPLDPRGSPPRRESRSKLGGARARARTLPAERAGEARPLIPAPQVELGHYPEVRRDVPDGEDGRAQERPLPRLRLPRAARGVATGQAAVVDTRAANVRAVPITLVEDRHED